MKIVNQMKDRDALRLVPRLDICLSLGRVLTLERGGECAGRGGIIELIVA